MNVDHLGTPQAITDEEGNIVWQADYKPFGEAAVTAGDVNNNFRFPGQYFDEETGLHYNWHRYYDPDTGRYLTPDPIGLEGGINLYSYALNNPVNLADPDGKNPLIGILILAGYYLLTNPDAANAPAPCDELHNSYGAEKIVGEGIVDIVTVGILSKVFKFVSMKNAKKLLVFRKNADDVISSSMRPARAGAEESRALQALKKKIDRNNPAFQGLEKSQEAANSVIREVLNTKNPVYNSGINRNGDYYIEIFNSDTGRGVRLINDAFDTFVNLR